VAVADELALEFGHALEVCTGNGYLQGHAALAHLEALDTLLVAMSGPEQAERWTHDALATDAGWSEVRAQADDALRAAGWADQPPPSGEWKEVEPGEWKYLD
jgi:hypothetical protein